MTKLSRGETTVGLPEHAMFRVKSGDIIGLFFARNNPLSYRNDPEYKSCHAGYSKHLHPMKISVEALHKIIQNNKDRYRYAELKTGHHFQFDLHWGCKNYPFRVQVLATNNSKWLESR